MDSYVDSDAGSHLCVASRIKFFLQQDSTKG